MEIVRTIAIYAGWGFVAIAALFAIGVVFMLIQSRNKTEEGEEKGKKVRAGGGRSGKPKRAKSLVNKVEAVSKEESAQRILGGTNSPLPSQMPAVPGLPQQAPVAPAAPQAVPSVQIPRPSDADDNGVTFVKLPGRLPEPPKL